MERSDKNVDRIDSIGVDIFTIFFLIVIGLNINLLLNFWIFIVSTLNLEGRTMANVGVFGALTTYFVISILLADTLYRILAYIFELIFKDSLNWLLDKGIFSFVLISIKSVINLFTLSVLMVLLGFIFHFKEEGLGIDSTTALIEKSEKYPIVKNIATGFFNNNLMDYIQKNALIYNGTTIAKSVESNIMIGIEAKSIIEGAKSDRDKAYLLYDWVGTNIEYDDELATMLSDYAEERHSLDSGAISAYETRKGICFDYAALYFVMAKEVGLPVKFISGFYDNGIRKEEHAWNEVYLEDEGIWVNVDPTFRDSSDSFDSEHFDEVRKDSHILIEG